MEDDSERLSAWKIEHEGRGEKLGGGELAR
jgi:hypothetical protein